MITAFLKNTRMELPTGSRNNIGGVPAGRSWIPLKNRETVLMMHEITVSSINVAMPIGFGLTKLDHRENKGSWFRERTSSCTRICTGRNVSSHKGGTCTSLVGRSTGCDPTCVEVLFSARVPKSSAEVRRVFIHDIKEGEGVGQQEQQGDKIDEAEGHEVKGEVEETRSNAHYMHG